MTLIERLDRVCAERGLSDRGWSFKAELSGQYVHTLRVRAGLDPSYRIPEKGAEKLARAANVSADWLRFGRGTMDGTSTTSNTPSTPSTTSNVRQQFIDMLGRFVGELYAAGEKDAAGGAATLLAQLTNGPARAPETVDTVPFPTATGAARR